MPVLVADRITKYYEADLILDAVSLTIDERDRIGLIGANGTGKTTLCRALLRELELDEGEVRLAQGATVGYLAQEAGFPEGQTLWEMAMGCFPALREMERRLRECEEQMAHAAADSMEPLLERHERIRAEYERAGGYEYQVRAATVLTGLGFAQADFGRELATFSGGEKSRAALATLLLRSPDLLLLDEPTNHLDIQGTEWLEEYLCGYGGAVVVISHDRRFLNQTVRRMLEIEDHQLVEYTGGYDDYVRQKEERLLNYHRRYEKQQRERERQLAFVRWALGTCQEKRVRAAKSRLKLLDKVEWLDPPASERRKVNLRFTPRIRGGDEVLELSGVTVGYPGVPLLRGLDLFLRRGDRLGVVGPNGCGKTTLLKVLLHELAPLAGRVRLGTSVEPAYYAQERPAVTTANTVLTEFGEVVRDATPGELRHLLARFLFVEDDVFKPVAALSGGEQSRLALAKLIMARPSFLILDEPTNHLDIDSREALEHALQQYTGTILVVSHDRYFLDAVVNQVLVIEEDAAHLHPGNYTAYREALREREEAQAQAEAAAREAGRQERLRQEKLARRERGQPGSAAAPRKLSPWQRERLTREVEQRVEEIEARVSKIQALLQDPEVCADAPRVRALSVEYERREQERHEAYEAWAELVED
jgi:ATP-binding cassette subfamily F protein 3